MKAPHRYRAWSGAHGHTGPNDGRTFEAFMPEQVAEMAQESCDDDDDGPDIGTSHQWNVTDSNGKTKAFVVSSELVVEYTTTPKAWEKGDPVPPCQECKQVHPSQTMNILLNDWQPWPLCIDCHRERES